MYRGGVLVFATAMNMLDIPYKVGGTGEGTEEGTGRGLGRERTGEGTRRLVGCVHGAAWLVAEWNLHAAVVVVAMAVTLCSTPQSQS